MTKSPAYVVKQLLTQLGYEQVFVGSGSDGGIPTTPDDVIGVVNTVGQEHPSTMVDAALNGLYGIQVKVRRADPRTSYEDTEEIRLALREAYNAEVNVGDASFLVLNFARIRQVMPMAMDGGRHVHGFNTLVNLRER